MKKLLVLALALLLSAAGGGRLPDTPAAVVVKVEGPVQIEPQGEDLLPATVGARLFPGDRVLPGADGRAVLVYRTGTTREATEELVVEIPGGEAGGDLFSRTLRVLAQAADSDARTRPNRQGMIRPLPGVSPSIIAPRNGIAVMETSPTFRWFPMEGAPGYRVQIRKVGGEIRRFETGPDTAWTLPAGAEALDRGEAYAWTVAPTTRGRPATEAEFTVLDRTRLESVEEQMELLEASGLDPAGDGAFLAAVVYREADLLYAAADALETLEEAGDPLGADAWLLKAEIMDALGDLDAARKAFDNADRMAR
jgi:hypothetical protein